MTVYVYQTFELKQEAFQDGLENLQMIQRYRNEHYDHEVRLLTPISGRDFTYVLLSKYAGLAEMELQNLKMFDDEQYLDLIGELFLEQIVQGSMTTQIYRQQQFSLEEKKNNK